MCEVDDRTDAKADHGDAFGPHSENLLRTTNSFGRRRVEPARVSLFLFLIVFRDEHATASSKRPLLPHTGERIRNYQRSRALYLGTLGAGESSAIRLISLHYSRLST